MAAGSAPATGTTDAMAVPVVEAIHERLTIALRVAQDTQGDEAHLGQHLEVMGDR